MMWMKPQLLVREVGELGGRQQYQKGVDGCSSEMDLVAASYTGVSAYDLSKFERMTMCQ